MYDEGAELDRLSAELRSDALDARLSATRRLAYMKAADAVPLLIGALRDDDAQVRAAAAAALGYKANPEAIAPLAVLLDDPGPEVRPAALRALDEIGMPRRRSWLQFWRERIVESPAEDPRVPDLLGRALADPDAVARETAVAVLPRHGARGVQVVRAHLEARRDSHPLEREAAEAEIARAVKARDPQHRRAAVEALHHLFGVRAVRTLAEALRDSSPEVRQAAVEAVTSLGPQPALEELLDRLDDSDEGVVVRVVEGLVCAHNLTAFSTAETDRIHDELLQLARKRTGRVQAVAVWALGEMGRVAAVSTLCEVLAGAEEASLVAACEALAKIEDARSVNHLMDLLARDPGPKATAAAARTLAGLADVRAVPALLKALFAEKRPEVEQALEDALRTLCAAVPDSVRADLHHADAATRVSAIRRAINEPRVVGDLLAQVLEGSDTPARAAALEVLGRQGYDLAGLARSTLALEDKSESRRILAIHLMTALHPDDAVSHLDHLLSDTNEPAEVYRHTVAALKGLGTDAAKSALLARQADPRPEIQSLVRAALGS